MKYSGSGISKGIAVGEAYIYEPFKPEILQTSISKQQTAAEEARYLDAAVRAQAELNAAAGTAAEGSERVGILTAHRSILSDQIMEREIFRRIRTDFFSADRAIESTYEKFANRLDAAKDLRIRERAADLRDVKIRLIRCLNGQEERNLSRLERSVVVFARDLLPSDAAMLDRQHVLAIITEAGGATSHTAILARSFHIPAILGVRDIVSHVQHGQTVIADAVRGDVYVDPNAEQLAHFRKESSRFAREEAETEEYLHREPMMKDGQRVGVYLNIKGGNEEDLQGAAWADGVGLFRTEFLFLEREAPPDEQEQFECYKKVLLAFGGHPVTLRTLDIGGDKTAAYLDLPHEENPFLGSRGLRFCLDRPDLFRTQLRAAYRASIYGELWLMLPMVGSLDEIFRAKALIEEVKEQLRAEGTKYSEDIKVGIMIEIPSIALIADKAAEAVDFASVGTNDLTQYLMAADRMNASVENYYQSYHPALFRILGQVTREFGKRGKPLSVCGELGGDPLAAVVLIGLGFRKLSMSLCAVPKLKRLICALTEERAEALSAAVCEMRTESEVDQFLQNELLANH